MSVRARNRPYEKSRPITEPICATSLAGPKPINARHQRLLQGGWDRLNTALLAAFQEQAGHFLYEQRYPAGAVGDAFDHFARQGMSGRKLSSTMCRT